MNFEAAQKRAKDLAVGHGYSFHIMCLKAHESHEVESSKVIEAILIDVLLNRSRYCGSVSSSGTPEDCRVLRLAQDAQEKIHPNDPKRS